MWLVRMTKALEVKKQASRGLVKETSWERKEDAATPEGNVPTRWLFVSMAAGSGRGEQHTDCHVMGQRVSNVPWYPHPFQCRHNPRECPPDIALTTTVPNRKGKGPRSMSCNFTIMTVLFGRRNMCSRFGQGNDVQCLGKGRM